MSQTWQALSEFVHYHQLCNLHRHSKNNIRYSLQFRILGSSSILQLSNKWPKMICGGLVLTVTHHVVPASFNINLMLSANNI